MVRTCTKWRSESCQMSEMMSSWVSDGLAEGVRIRSVSDGGAISVEKPVFVCGEMKALPKEACHARCPAHSRAPPLALASTSALDSEARKHRGRRGGPHGGNR